MPGRPPRGDAKPTGVVLGGIVGTVVLSFSSLIIAYVSLLAGMLQDSCTGTSTRWQCTNGFVFLVMAVMWAIAGGGGALGLWLTWRRKATAIATVFAGWFFAIVQWISLIIFSSVVDAAII